MTREVTGLTEMETLVLSTLINMLYEPGFSDVDVADLSDATGIDKKVIRGVVSSLVQKGYVYIDDNNAGYKLVYLNEKHYDLHPVFSKQLN